MKSQRTRISLAVVGLLVLVGAWLPAEPKARDKRVRPPKWTSETEAIFFKDAFREALSGERPKSDSNTGLLTGKSKERDSRAQIAPRSWMTLISSSTIEDEIKSIKNELDRNVTTPNQFSGGAHREARQSFGIAATLMRMVAEYDGEVRWKQFGMAMSEEFARTAANAKVGTIQVYNEARLRKVDLQDLLAGATPSVANGQPDWIDVADRVLIMQRMEIGQAQRIPLWTSPREFSKHAGRVQHEAELMGAFARVLKAPGMPDADDPDYSAMCESFLQSAVQLRDAATTGNSEVATRSIRDLRARCDTCHQKFRE